MGGVYSSKPNDDAIVSPEDTRFLLGSVRHKRICNAFERISGGKGLDSKAFQMYILGGFQMMPKFLADRIFFALDRTGRGTLTAPDFVASMAVMLSSSPEATEGRYFLLFRIYDVFHRDSLERASLKRILHIAYPEIKSSELNDAVDAFFGKSSALVYEEFRMMLYAYTNSKRTIGDLLTNWFYTICDHLMDEPAPELIAMEQRYNQERGLRKFASVHGIHDQTIAVLNMRHAALCKQGVSGRLDPGVFCQVVDSVIHEDLALRVFSCYTSASRLRWTMLDFVTFCQFAVRGSIEGQQQLLFNLFDDDRDGILNQPEVELMLAALAWHHIHRDGKFSQLTAPYRTRSHSVCSAGRSSNGRKRAFSIPGSHKYDKGDHLLVYGLCKMGYEATHYDLAQLAQTILNSAAEKSNSISDDDDFNSPEEFVTCDGLTLPGFVLWMTENRGRMQLLFDLCLVAIVEFHMPPANLQQEKRIIEDIRVRYAATHVSEMIGFKYGPPGTWWALISAHWWNWWRTFVGYDDDDSGSDLPCEILPSLSSSSHTRGPPPGIIYNQILLKGDLQLEASLRHGIDYECLPSSAWESLQRWYGGGPSIQREVVRVPCTNHVDHEINIGEVQEDNVATTQEEGLLQYRDDIELYPFILRITFCNAQGHALLGGRYLLYSKYATGQDLLEHLSAINKLEPERMRLWNYVDRVDWHSQSLLDLQRTLLELNLSDYRLILVEVSQPNGSWPRSQLQSMLEVAEEENREASLPVKKVNDSRLNVSGGLVGTSSRRKFSSVGSQSLEAGGGLRSSQSAPRTFGDGLTGMNNLGNTCYVSSTMQCLSHTPLLKDYFLNLNYLRDVNVENKMGQGGRLAQESVYAQLVQELWSPSKKTVTPKQFKSAIAQFNDQFSGNDQHDAHDLLTFVLNGLNEDLNRIAEKPYIEQPDSDGRSDKELADIWWCNHLRRELSIVIALFGGQFKSLLTCNNCGYGSARFEPFLCLQLPLPEVSFRPVSAVFVPLSGSLCPLQCVVEVHRTGTVRDTVVALVEMVKNLRRSSGSDSSHDSCSGGWGTKDNVEEDMEDEVASRSSDKGEQLSAYGYLKLGPEDLVVVDTTSERIFSIIPMSMKLSSIKDKTVLYFYQLEYNPPPSAAVSTFFDSDAEVIVKKSDHCLAGFDGTTATAAAAQETMSPHANTDDQVVKCMDVDDNTGHESSSTICRPMDSAEEEENILLKQPIRDGSNEVWDDEDESSPPSGDGRDDNIPAASGSWRDDDEAEADECTTIGVNISTRFDATRATRRTNKHEAAALHLSQGDPHAAASAAAAADTRSTPTPSLPTYKNLSNNQSFYYVLQRSLERSNMYFVNYFRLQLLDMPLICSLDSQRLLTGIELYDWLSSRFQRFIKDPIHISSMHEDSKGRKRVHRPRSTKSSLTLDSFRNMDWSETYNRSSGGGSFSSDNNLAKDKVPLRCGPTRVTSAEIAAGPVNQWGFRLAWVSSNGTACGKCNWMKGCVGCLIPPNNEVVQLRHGDTIAVDWHISIMKERYDGAEAFRKAVHSSVRNSQKLENCSFNLERCMDAFTAEEIIPEGYCSKCKKLMPSKIKMDIWRLPPILVIQLKRFQYTDYSRMKLRNKVHFPIHGLDLSPWIVKDHMGSSLVDECRRTSSPDGVQNGGSSNIGRCDETVDGMQCEGVDINAESAATTSNEHGRETYPGKDGRDESLYDLYAVVHHLGALSAGHYVASVKDKDGVWHYFNDNQVYDMDEKNLVSPSAYILFYIRRDMRGISIDDVYPAQVASGNLDLSEIEAMMRQRDSAHCQIS